MLIDRSQNNIESKCGISVANLSMRTTLSSQNCQKFFHTFCERHHNQSHRTITVPKLINFSISYQIAPSSSIRRLFWLLANSTYFPIFHSREPPQKRLQFPSSKQLRWWGRSPSDTRHVELFLLWGFFFSSLFDALTRNISSSLLARSTAADEWWWWFVRWVFLHLSYQ